MSWKYDGFDMNDGVTYFIDDATSDPFNMPDFEVIRAAFANRDGGVLLAKHPGPQTVPLAGTIKASVNDGAWLTARDALYAKLAVQRLRLQANYESDAFKIAIPRNVRSKVMGMNWGTWSADFEIADPYAQSLTPSADVRTPTLALSSGTDYLAQFSLTPGGTAPAPARIIIANLAGGVTPTNIKLRNTSTGEYISLNAAAGSPAGADVAANSVLVVDPLAASKALVSPLTNVIGWWPMWDASGNAIGFGPAQLDLTVSGAPVYRQDAAFPFGPQIGIEYDGVDDYHESTNAAFDVTGPITMGAWVIPGAASTAMTILSQASAGAGYTLRRTAANVFEAAIGNTTGPTFRTATGTRTVVVGQPYHVMMTATGGTVTLYVNGEVEAVTGGGALSQSVATNGFRVGGGHNIVSGAAEFWDGIIADAIPTSDAWTQAQVKTAMKQGVAAVHGVAAPVQGLPVSLDPRAGATNVLQLVGAHGASAPTLRLAAYWRSRYA